MDSGTLSDDLKFWPSLKRFLRRKDVSWVTEAAVFSTAAIACFLASFFIEYRPEEMRQALFAGISVCAAFTAIEVASFAVFASIQDVRFLMWVAERIPLADMIMQFRLSLASWVIVLSISAMMLLLTYLLKTWSVVCCVLSSALGGLYGMALVLTVNAFETIVYWFLYRAAYLIQEQKRPRNASLTSPPVGKAGEDAGGQSRGDPA